MKRYCTSGNHDWHGDNRARHCSLCCETFTSRAPLYTHWVRRDPSKPRSKHTCHPLAAFNGLGLVRNSAGQWERA